MASSAGSFVPRPARGPALAIGLTMVAVVWSALIVSSPRMLSSPSWSVASTLVYSSGARICHQRPERSFRAAGMQWPVCARCAGLYLAGTLGLLAGWFGAGDLRDRRHAGLLALMALPTAVTWGLEAAGVMPFSNGARFVAALPLGVTAGWLFIRALRYDSGLDAREIHHRRPTSLPG